MWTPLEFLVGTWQGVGEGQPGKSQVERTYQFVLRGKFLQVKSQSLYAPRGHTPQGELHEEIGLYSYDNARKTFVFRQFHAEGFVNQYVMDALASKDQRLVFLTESIENIAAGWRARETYLPNGPDEFTERFELAAPGKDFELYSESLFIRRP